MIARLQIELTHNILIFLANYFIIMNISLVLAIYMSWKLIGFCFCLDLLFGQSFFDVSEIYCN